uniref:Uncharacterized protein n=1 Tax=Meloidogyne javanica TaxID=6303 RepID=A0A915N3Y8_MELJA
MQLSSLAELKLNPTGSWLGFCRGLIKSVLKSSTKTTIVLECDSGELFVVTAFHTTKNSASILESYFKDLDNGNVLEIKKCFAAIEDQCIVLTAAEDNVTISKKKMVIGKMLSTPIKTKDGEKK